MNNLRKEAALKKYLPLTKTNTKEQIMDMINSDEKEYSSAEALEIMQALSNNENVSNPPPGPAAGSQGPDETGENKNGIGPGPGENLTSITNAPIHNQEEKPKTLNRIYEEWKVKPKYEKKRGDDGTMKNVYVGCEKDAQAPIRKTSVTPERAAQVNEQTENTLLHLFLAEGQEEVAK